jgi:hypothetical protein
MAKYEPRRPSGARPLVVLGISDVIVLESAPTVPTSRHRVSAWGRWTREVDIPDAAPAIIRDLGERFDIVWASEWGHNAHTAFRDALQLPEDPWPFLPVQFDKLAAIRRYAQGLPWAWIDGSVVDLDEDAASLTDGVIVRVDPSQGIAGVDAEALADQVAEKDAEGRV